MQTIDTILNNNGIRLSSTEEGTKKTKCPQCQPPHNPRDNPLSVTINYEGVVWKCHHCDWTGGGSTKSGGIYRPTKKPKYVKPVEPNIMKSNISNLDKYFESRKISRSTYEKFKIFEENNWFGFQYFDKDGSLANIKYI